MSGLTYSHLNIRGVSHHNFKIIEGNLSFWAVCF